MKYDLLYLAAGALLGVFLRYKMTGSPLFLGSLPVSVLLVNVIGSLILGMSSTAVSELGLDERYTLLVGIGFCGSLTTMSGLAFETVNMIDVGQVATASLDIILNVGASLGAILLGRAVVTLLLGLG
jgi:fluoride exporter